ncbi:MAG TPA: phosphatidylinositol-specific phospholipase C1-like protein [Cyclobacteriaceae bacterium]|nr:phosphatidylinositol-specific phospholipase C1-like protein [Cyclobacteriaceae bacterium]
MKIKSYSIFLMLVLMGCNQKKETVKLNQLQVIGSHNSYKQAIDSSLFKLLLAKDSNALALGYYHLPLTEQLDLGLRGLEIDVLHDPTGGRYQYPQGIVWAKQNGIELAAHDTLHVLSEPGMKTLHVPDIDFKSSCLTFKNCLNEIKNWSAAHPDHTPILITINTKDSGVNQPGATKVLPFTEPVLDSLDAELLSVFPVEKLITPLQVRGDHATLREAIIQGGWPAVDAVKGRIMFILDAPEKIITTYNSNGKERPMFVSVPENDSHAAFFILNEPLQQKDQILSLVKQGFIVRTRADAETREARTETYDRWEAAKASGAQLISTDYYVARLSPTGKFEISFDKGKYSRCNPVTGLRDCKD